MKVTVFGAGYVGMSLAAILCVKNEAVLVDIDPVKVTSVNNGRYPVSHDAICEYLKDKKYNLHATLDPSECSGSDYILIATPTNYDPDSKYFDTSSIDSVVNLVNNLSPESILVIRSTVPIGYTEILNSRYPGLTILFSPEFPHKAALYLLLYFGLSRINESVSASNHDPSCSSSKTPSAFIDIHEKTASVSGR